MAPFKTKTNAYWRNTLGINETCFVERKAAVLARLRSKWSNRRLLIDDWHIPKDRVKEWLRPLIQRFYSEDNRAGIAQHRDSEEMLRIYTRWAFIINSNSRDDRRTVQPRFRAMDNHVQDNTSRPESAVKQQMPESYQTGKVDELATEIKLEATNTGSSVDHPMRISPTPPPPDSTQPAGRVFDWDRMEVEIDANLINEGIVQIPGIQLKPQKHSSCGWDSFRLRDLKSCFEAETGLPLDPAAFEFVYDGKNHDRYTFHREGGYRIMLKRFVEGANVSGTDDYVLRLCLQARATSTTSTSS